jgi:hypothetical protein
VVESTGPPTESESTAVLVSDEGVLPERLDSPEARVEPSLLLLLWVLPSLEGRLASLVGWLVAPVLCELPPGRELDDPAALLLVWVPALDWLELVALDCELPPCTELPEGAELLPLAADELLLLELPVDAPELPVDAPELPVELLLVPVDAPELPVELLLLPVDAPELELKVAQPRNDRISPLQKSWRTP